MTAAKPTRRVIARPDKGERAFVYAKACGIIGKSFTGRRISSLKNPKSLNELDRLVFPESARNLPGRELLVDLENRILRRTIRHIMAVINSYSQPPELLVLQLRACEYADVKTCLHYISGSRTEPPMISNIGRFGTVRFKKYPDIAAMLAGTEFEFILKKYINAIKTPGFDFAPLEAELDLRYYTLLIQSLYSLSADDSLYALQILTDEISLRNCIWALRLRTYFKKRAGETAKYLLDQKMPLPSRIIPGSIHPHITNSGSEVSLAAEALEMLRFSLDTRSNWKGWRWESLLNPEVAGTLWSADPRYFQNAASRYIYRLSLRCFALMPFSVSSVFCFIKLKQFEEDILTSITEGLGLGMNGKDIFDMLEVPS